MWLMRLTFLAIAVYHDLLLFCVGPLHGHHCQPRALVVLNICADLSGDFWISKAVKEIVLNLEEVTHFQKNGLRLSKGLGVFVSKE